MRNGRLAPKQAKYKIKDATATSAPFGGPPKVVKF